MSFVIAEFNDYDNRYRNNCGTTCMTLTLQIVLLLAFPYGTAVLLGALGERLGGKTVSSLASVAGLCLGIYFLHKSFEIIFTS